MRRSLLLLFLWMGVFLAGGKLFGYRGVFSVLGLSTLTPSNPQFLSIWTWLFIALLESGLLSLLVFSLWRVLLWDRKFSFAEVLFLLAPVGTGLMVSVFRLFGGVESADLILCLEPVFLACFFPLFLTMSGALLLKVFRIPSVLIDDSSFPLFQFVVKANLVAAPAIAILYFLFGTFGIWNPAVVWTLAVLLILAGAPPFFRQLRQLSMENQSAEGQHPLQIIGLVSIIAVVVLASQLCWLPPDDSDELRYHLAFPKRSLELGEWAPLPDQMFSYFPCGLDIMMTLPVSLDWLRYPENRLGLTSGGKFIHFWFFSLCVMTIWMWSREIFRMSFSGEKESAVGWTGSLISVWLFVSIPFVPVLASWAFVDFGSAFGWLVSGYFGWRFLRAIHPESAQGSRESNEQCLAILTAFGLGWSLQVKYTGLAWLALFAAAFISFLVIQRLGAAGSKGVPSPKGDRAGAKELSPLVGWVALIVLLPPLLASPWFLSNWARTGNPFYPLFSDWFGAGFSEIQADFYAWHAGLKGNLNPFRSLGPLEKTIDLLLLPFRAALYPWQFENNPIGGLLPALLPCAIYAGCLAFRRLSFLLGLSIIAFLLWAFTYRDPRFAIPLWGFLSILIGGGLATLIHQRRRGPSNRWLFYSLAGLVFFWGWGQCEEVLLRNSKYGDAIRLSVHPDDYLSRRLPGFRALREGEAMRREQKPTPVLLLLGQEQSYYFDSPVRGADYFDGPWLAPIAASATSVESISSRIKELGIRWIWVNRGTLEENEANLFRGRLFTMEKEKALEALHVMKNSADIPFSLEVGDEALAFRLMHAWLIRHPGFREIPLSAVEKSSRPLSPHYRGWLHWSELQGISVEELPRSRNSLLVAED